MASNKITMKENNQTPPTEGATDEEHEEAFDFGEITDTHLPMGSSEIYDAAEEFSEDIDY